MVLFDTIATNRSFSVNFLRFQLSSLYNYKSEWDILERPHESDIEWIFHLPKAEVFFFLLRNENTNQYLQIIPYNTLE